MAASTSFPTLNRASPKSSCAPACSGFRLVALSSGFTLAELADKLIALGAVDAVNLDGGGSSTMVGSDGKVLNRPSDTGSAEVIVERKISTAVVISEVN